MSRFCTVLTSFQDGKALVDALVEMGWNINQIEIHHEPQHLFGYKGDRREEKANIIIRRKNVGEDSNDIGFAKGEDGSYATIISEYDANQYNEQWIGKLKGSYAFHKIKREQENRGRKVVRSRCRKTGKQRIEVSGYR